MLAVNRDQHWPLTAWLAMIILKVLSPSAWHPAKGADTRWCDRPAVRGGLNPNGDRSSGGQQPEGLIPARISPPAHPALPLIFRLSHSCTCCRCRPGPLLPPRYHEDQKGLIAFWLQERSLRRSGTAAEQLQAAFGSRGCTEQARGKLAERFTMDHAFRLLRTCACNSSRRRPQLR
jgi:hypothetical protein